MHENIYGALGNKVRSKLVLCLSKEQKNVSDLINNCGLAQSAVSQHLLKLKKTGILETKKQGKEIFYSLKHKKAAEIAQLLVLLEKELS